MKWLEVFQREDGCPSLARVVVTLNLLIWMFVSLHSYLFNKIWNHYDTYTCVVWIAFLGLIANKYVECKFLTIKAGDQK